MGLIKCPDCGNPNSSSASSCPRCGRKIKHWGTLEIVVAIIAIICMLAYLSYEMDLNGAINFTGGQ